MNKFVKIGKLALIGLFLTTMNNSCTNLDETLYDQIAADKFYKSPEESVAALGAAYTKLYGYANHGNMFSIGEVCTDEVVIPQRGGDWGDGGIWLRFQRHTWNVNEGYFNNVWNFCYAGISDCNRLLYQFDQQIKGGNTAVQPFIAELKVLRALFYYWLLDMFGNVPIVTQFVGASKNPANNTRAEVYAFVEKELTDNASLLSKDAGSTYGRMNYYVAQAILAKLYLNAQVYTGTAQWAKAVAASDEIINSNKYKLEGNYFDNFKAQNQTSAELIFVIPYDKVNAQGFNLPQMTLHYQSQRTYNLTDQPWNGYCALQEFYNSYDNTDVRKRAFLVGPQFASDGSRLSDDGAEAADPDGKPLTFTPELNQHEPDALRQAGARIGKYEFERGATPNLSNDFPIFRLGDILLVKAEALWRQNNASTEALSLVNQIRSRAGVPAFTSLTADNLLAERGREMFAETWRRQDMIRFGKFAGTWKIANGGLIPVKPNDDNAAKRSLFPIPQDQINANPNLRQNTGY